MDVFIFVSFGVLLGVFELQVYLSLPALQPSQPLSQLLQFNCECLVLFFHSYNLVPSILRLETLDFSLELGYFFDVLCLFAGLHVLGGIFLIPLRFLLDDLALPELVVLILLYF